MATETDLRNSQVLRTSATIIRHRGWARGTLEDLFGRVCVNGAIMKAYGMTEKGLGRDLARIQETPAAVALKKCLGLMERQLWEWNDGRVESSPDSEAEVIAALMGCADSEEQVGR